MAKSESTQNQWDVLLTAAAAKQKRNLPEEIQAIFARLLGEMEKCGPIRNNWKNFSKLSEVCVLSLPPKKGETDICSMLESGG